MLLEGLFHAPFYTDLDDVHSWNPGKPFNPNPRDILFSRRRIYIPTCP